MKALVTGATGFIGANLTRELVNQGFRVRCLVRPDSDTRYIDSVNADQVVGDLLDRSSLERAVEGCEVLFHTAAFYSFWTPRPAIVYETNVGGTMNILTAALRKGIKRAVFTSTESTVGINGSGPGTEQAVACENETFGHYKKSKIRAEKLALQASHEGLPLIVVNPTMPVGRYDSKPTPSGQVIVDFLNRRMPAWVDAGLNVVDVEDVAKGHFLALDRGRVGERYLLGNRNLTFREILDILENVSGQKAPKLRLPLCTALGAAYVDEAFSGRIMGRTPRICVAAVRTAGKKRHFDCSKAVRELGLPQSPIEGAYKKAVEWFVENGYVESKYRKGMPIKGGHHA